MLIQYCRKHFFSYSLVVLLILAVSASYYRFVVTKDYIVSYEGDCNPYSQNCFEFCEDEECAEPFYYSVIERNAAEISQLCGNDVTECEEAFFCPDTVSYCTITYCDPTLNVDECELLTESDFVPETNLENI